MAYYKVVKVLDDKLYSSFFEGDPHDCRLHVEYKVDKWVKAPNNTRLFVFNDLDLAKGFMKNCIGYYNLCNDKFRIYECKIVGCIKAKPPFWSKDIPDFWNVFNKFYSKKKKFIPPNIPYAEYNSILAKKVKLIKELYETQSHSIKEI